MVMSTTVVLLIMAGWATRHLYTAEVTLRGNGPQFALIFTMAFLILAWQMMLAFVERPKAISERDARMLAHLNLTVNVPVYNEDPALLAGCLVSLFSQSRLPDHIFVVDDGSTKADYSLVRREFKAVAHYLGVRATWLKTPNRGKRHAQGETVKITPEADIYVTVDSDAILDYQAIEEVIKPFADPGVQSVAGLVCAANNQKNLLTRFTDLWFVVGQLVDRSSLSAMGAVLVNSGVLAAYRADVIRDNLNSYLNETFFGRRVEFSDDSMLTIFALLRGKAVQQPTAFAFTAMPENLQHHLRQYIRWMRGAFIRTWWRFKYLPLSSYAYWGHLLGWIQMMVSTAIFVTLFVIGPATGNFSPYYIVIPLLVGYGQSLRYLTFRRRDERFRSQLLTWFLSPVASLWAFFVLRFVRWYAMCTCLKTGWGTRQDVEVHLEGT